jgi:tetratricopeptide (TPR) repeat protein
VHLIHSRGLQGPYAEHAAQFYEQCQSAFCQYYLAKGRALIHQEDERYIEAKQAYETAYNLNSKNLWALKGLANSLRLLGQVDEAMEKYREIIGMIDKSTQVDRSILELLGWCHYCLGDYNEALRRYFDAKSIDNIRPSLQFDIALILMVGARFDRALAEYNNALEMASSKHPMERRGILSIALYDLQSAMIQHHELGMREEALMAHDLLENAFNYVKNSIELLDIDGPEDLS